MYIVRRANRVQGFVIAGIGLPAMPGAGFKAQQAGDSVQDRQSSAVDD